MASFTPHVPPMLWAQRKDGIFLTINVQDIVNEKVDVTATTLKFSGETDDEHKYEFSMDFHASIVPEESIWKVTGRNVLMHFVKEKKDDEHWPRLSKNKAFDKSYVATDWVRYIDEDDEDHRSGFDMSSLDGAANFGNLGEQDDDPDSDDDGTSPSFVSDSRLLCSEPRRPRLPGRER